MLKQTVGCPYDGLEAHKINGLIINNLEPLKKPYSTLCAPKAIFSAEKCAKFFSSSNHAD